MRLVVATLRFAGLGFALRLQEEGHDVVLAHAGIQDRRLEDNYSLVGNGLVPKQPLADLLRDRASWRDAVWLWDENHSVDANEWLRSEGFRVFLGGRYADTRVVQESVGRLLPEYRRMRYTGFGDANFIVSRDGIWSFEKCERFGYSAHPNLFWSLNRAPLGDTFAALVDGTFIPDFAPGFGASVTLYMDHPAAGKVVQYPPAVARDIYPYDIYRQGDQLLTAGYYGDALLLACAFGYTIPTAWEAALAVASSVRFAGRAYRLDGAATDFPSSPLRRYEALTAMGYI